VQVQINKSGPVLYFPGTPGVMPGVFVGVAAVRRKLGVPIVTVRSSAVLSAPGEVVGQREMAGDDCR
jgi:hypothetical protein